MIEIFSLFHFNPTGFVFFQEFDARFNLAEPDFELEFDKLRSPSADTTEESIITTPDVTPIIKPTVSSVKTSWKNFPLLKSYYKILAGKESQIVSEKEETGKFSRG